MQVAQRFAETTRGIVGFRLHRVLDVHAGFSGRHEDMVIAGVYQDGTVVRVRIVSYTIDGKPASATDTASMTQAYEHPKPGDVFAPPFDSRNVDAYSYHEAGPATIGFESSLHDAGHGDGTFTYDGAADVVSCTYQPNALPPHATWGEVSDKRAEVLPNYWAVTQETQQYKGRYGIFPGAATEEFDFSDFRRFSDLPTALSSL